MRFIAATDVSDGALIKRQTSLALYCKSMRSAAKYLARALPFDFGLEDAESRHSGLGFRMLMALGLLDGELLYRP